MTDEDVTRRWRQASLALEAANRMHEQQAYWFAMVSFCAGVAGWLLGYSCGVAP